jgi:hypothetical protein
MPAMHRMHRRAFVSVPPEFGSVREALLPLRSYWAGSSVENESPWEI